MSSLLGLGPWHAAVAGSVIGIIIAASVIGQQVLDLLPVPHHAIMLSGAGLGLFAIAIGAAPPGRRLSRAVLLTGVGLIGLLLHQAGLLKIVELMHVACFGSLVWFWRRWA